MKKIYLFFSLSLLIILSGHQKTPLPPPIRIADTIQEYGLWTKIVNVPKTTNKIPIYLFFIKIILCLFIYNTILLLYHPHGLKVAHLHELKVGWIN